LQEPAAFGVFPMAAWHKFREIEAVGRGNFTTVAEALAKLPGVWYKIGMVVTGMKTENPVLFAGGRQEGDFSRLCPCAARRQANFCFAKTSCMQAALCLISDG